MPKVVLQVQRKAMTRSRTQDEKRAEPSAEQPGSPGRPRSRAPTPKPGQASEPKSTITRVLKASVKVADRKYFTVAEDNAILHYYHLHKAKQTSRAIAETLAKRVKHSVESIRDRIKRFLSRIQPADQTLIHEEAKVNPGYFVHFARENNKKKRTVTHISSAVPKVAGSTLSMTEKRILARELSRQKKLVASPHQKLSGAFVGSPLHEADDGSLAVKNLSTDELFKLRDDHERSLKEKSVQYSSKLRKRSPKAYRSSTEFLSPVLKRPSRREFFRERSSPSRRRRTAARTQARPRVESRRLLRSARLHPRRRRRSQRTHPLRNHEKLLPHLRRLQRCHQPRPGRAAARCSGRWRW